MINERPLGVTAPTGPLNTRYVTSDHKQLAAGMTATLTADLAGRVPPGLVAEIVRSVLDEGRQAAQVRADEIMMFEARARLERFIRARASR
ncbi:MAG TPA: hypothetical protein VLQ79_13020 [Myxococcaceae bacterium]|nr:hypothetical protein [Myxococcaceae bacterium]